MLEESKTTCSRLPPAPEQLLSGTVEALTLQDFAYLVNGARNSASDAFRVALQLREGSLQAQFLRQAALWDYPGALDKLVALADTGNPECKYQAFLYYYEKKDFDSAWAWVCKASEQQHAGAQYYRGILFNGGWGWGRTDITESLKWLSRAARQNHVEALRTLSTINFEDANEPVDYVEAFGGCANAFMCIAASLSYTSKGAFAGMLKPLLDGADGMGTARDAAMLIFGDNTRLFMRVGWNGDRPFSPENILVSPAYSFVYVAAQIAGRGEEAGRLKIPLDMARVGFDSEGATFHYEGGEKLFMVAYRPSEGTVSSGSLETPKGPGS
jgi:hypothetical protein